MLSQQLADRYNFVLSRSALKDHVAQTLTVYLKRDLELVSGLTECLLSQGALALEVLYDICKEPDIIVQ